MKKIVSPREFSGSSARFGISEVLRISPRFYGYIRTCSIITKLVAMLNDQQHDILKSSGDCPFGATFGLTSELESFVLLTKFIAWDSPSLTFRKNNQQLIA